MCYVICTQSYIRFDACPAATSGWLLSGGCGKVCQMFLRFLFSPSRFDVLPPGRDGPPQSGRGVGRAQGAATYGGYLTWDDHPVRPKQKATNKNMVKTLNHCRPFGCVSNLE